MGGSGGVGGGDARPQRDTSGYEGFLAWSTGQSHGVHVWDLAESRIAFEREQVVLEELPGFSTLSQDASSLAYVLNRPYVLTSFFSTVQLVDLASGASVPYTDQGLAAGDIRNTHQPSLNVDGTRVAVAVSTSSEDGMGGYTNGSPPSIEVWDRASDTRFVITNGDEVDAHPLLDQTGENVVFLSKRDQRDGDFYRAPVRDGAPITRLGAFEHPDLRDLRSVDWFGRPSLSADGRWLAFIGGVKDGQDDAFLLDTIDGGIERLGLERASAVAISADGSRIAAIGWLEDEEVGIRGAVYTALRTELAELQLIPTDPVVVSSPIALSADGSQIAFVANFEELWVIRSDGSDARLVSGSEEGTVMPLLGMSLCF